MQLHPFSSSASLSPFTHYVCDERSCVVVVSPNNVLQLNESLLFESPSHAPRRYRSFNNYYASDFMLPGLHTACPDAIAASLGRREQAPTQLVLSPMKDDATTERYLLALNQNGWRSQKYAVTGNWYLPCFGLSYAAYLAQMLARGGNPVRRKAKAFFKSQHNRVEIVTDLSTRPELEHIYHAVYKKSWHGYESHPEYISAWMRSCAARGWLRLGIAWVGDQPVAVQFWFKIGHKAFIYKMAYDQNYAEWSAGTVLTGEMFRHALDIDGVREIDFLSGDDAYKRVWMTHRRQLVGIEAFNIRTAAGLTRWFLHKCARSAQALARAQRGETAEPTDLRTPQKV